eukprot:Seg1822.9 transcript_id=Seg1822.9/GoldUCD/mRNA.D3Y31 product="Integrin beta-PS" protein_id=Seg1822.9/GoldUCD/D3Y31
MEVTLARQILLLLMFFSSSVLAQGNSNPCAIFDASCATCVNGGPNCVWCADEDFQKTNKQRPRCDLRETMNKVCNNKTDPSSTAKQAANTKPLSQDVQLTPQIIDLKLRIGVPAKFQIKVKSAKNYPVDLYYLMDLSYSMADDLLKLQALGSKIATAIGSITTRYRLAFGSFVDKTVSPYVQVENEYPCTSCRKTFGFIHNQNFTSNAQEFANGVKAQKISGNLDMPEGGLDALMQVAACEKKIGWLKKDTSRRIVVFVTDAAFHSAGDGKLGGIVLPNDGKCHLDANGKYTMTNTLDYPSVGFLKAKLKEAKIVPILAVTNNVKTMYENLALEWKDLGTTAGALSADSSNVVGLIKDNYKKISSTVRLVDSNPEDIKIEYKSTNCQRKTADNECSNVAIDQEVTFEVSVTAQRCSEAAKKQKSFTISIAGFGDVTVNTNIECDCNCEKAPLADLNSTRCFSSGKFACGKCYCDPGRYGSDCKCTDKSAADESQCRPTNTSTGSVCSKAGTCICGTCECTPRKDPAEKISGTHCECRNFGCDLHDGKECGGSERGVCECNKCKCKGIWMGSNCAQKNCTMVQRNCYKNGIACGGHGSCDCGKCYCEVGYRGAHCENCPSCPGQCSVNRDCVLCQVFKQGPDAVCKNCSLNIVQTNGTMTGRKCEIPDNNGCYVVFSYGEDSKGNTTVWVNPKKSCPQTISSDANILAIVLGIIGGLVLAAIVALLVWKLLVSTYDKFEYSKFEKERTKSKWNKAENPIYKGAQQKYDNPVYAGQKK